jgi:hypothetical protein
MALSDDQLGRIEALFSGPTADTAVGEFRQRFPGVSVTRCDLSDMGDAPPFRRLPRFNLYLVDRSDHCVTLTCDPKRASGIVLAQLKAGA